MRSEEERPQRAGQKREYVPPTLEKLGTIRDLTHGSGSKMEFDNTHPPGQNKSAF